MGAAGICGSDAAEYAHPQLIRDRAGRNCRTSSSSDTSSPARSPALGPGAPGGLLGQLVACGAGISCGSCAMCARGRTNLCRDYHTLGFQRDGGLAEYVTAPASICVPGRRARPEHGHRGARPADGRSRCTPASAARCARGRWCSLSAPAVSASFLTYACAARGAQVWAADVADDRLALARGARRGARDQLRVPTNPRPRWPDAGVRRGRHLRGQRLGGRTGLGSAGRVTGRAARPRRHPGGASPGPFRRVDAARVRRPRHRRARMRHGSARRARPAGRGRRSGPASPRWCSRWKTWSRTASYHSGQAGPPA